jgi:hypothetical protein
MRSLLEFIRRLINGIKSHTAAQPPLEEMRQAMVESVIDCSPKSTRAVRTQVSAATSAQQLWLLRSEVYQAVSDEFGQSEAERRISALTPLFEGFVNVGGPRKSIPHAHHHQHHHH